MKFSFGKNYKIAGLDGIWRIIELEYIKHRNFITLVRFARKSDGAKKCVRNIDEKDLTLVVKEEKKL